MSPQRRIPPGIHEATPFSASIVRRLSRVRQHSVRLIRANRASHQITRWMLRIAAATSCGSLLNACERGSRSQSGTVSTEYRTAAKPLGPIPTPNALAEPKSPNQVGVPAALTLAVTPTDNPQTPDKIALGQRLFFDGRLSANGTVACSSCHDPRRAFTDGRPVSVGIESRLGQRNAPTILNALYNKTQFWDGRAGTLEQQAVFPITNPVEMGQPGLATAVSRLEAIPEYGDAFRRVFGRSINGTDLVRAIASYERSQIAFDSPFDHFIAGDSSAIDASARRGWVLFNSKARCSKCHALTDTTSRPTTFTDNDFHNIGIGILRYRVVELAQQAEELVEKGDTLAIDRAAIVSPMSAVGRYLVTRKDSDIASFKTPDLRNVLVTGPYFHDGSANTLWDVMDHYNKGDGVHDPYLDQDIQPLALTELEIADVVALMASLTSPPYKEVGERELARQRALSRTSRPQRDSARAFGPKPRQPAAPPIR
jgi:cytochrome c peroxidase